MAKSLRLDDIKGIVESTYPAPVAVPFKRARTTDKADLGGRHKSLIDLFEALVQFLCIVQLQEGRALVPNLRDRLPGKEKTLDFLKHPAIGAWVGLLRTLCDTLTIDHPTPRWIKPISDWYRQARTPEALAVLDELARIDNLQFQRGTSAPHAEILNALVTYRNTEWAHAANIHPDEMSKRLPILESALAYLFKSLAFLGDMYTLWVDRVEALENKQWRIHAKRLNGAGEAESVTFSSSNQLDLHEVYIDKPDEDTLSTQAVVLGPFILYLHNDDRRRNEVYFYSNAKSTRLIYVSYASGDKYYHRELHSGFADLITLKLRPGVDEDQHRDLSQTERALQAEHYFKRAVLLKEKGHLEESLEVLEESAEYEQRLETYLEMARIQTILRDPAEAVRLTLQEALRLAPGNPEALGLLGRLEERDGLPSDGIESERGPEDQHFTLLEAVLPYRLRRYALALWIGLFLCWFSVSAAVEFVTGHIEHLFPVVLECLICILISGGTILGRVRFLRLSSPLSIQTDMKAKRFNEFFGRYMQVIFGRYSYQEHHLDWKKTLSGEKMYYIFLIVWILLCYVPELFLTRMVELHPLHFLKRLVDYVLVYALMYVGARHIVTTTMFVHSFSRLHLKPMLTKINDDGLRSFGPMISENIWLTSTLAVLYGTHAMITITIPSNLLELPFLVIGFMLFLGWSLAMPVELKRAARDSKGDAVQAYSDHIEKAFQSFLKNPDDSALKRYQWLLANQKVIKRICTWPLSWVETLTAIVGGNAFILAFFLWYSSRRISVVQQLFAQIRHLF